MLSRGLDILIGVEIGRHSSGQTIRMELVLIFIHNFGQCLLKTTWQIEQLVATSLDWVSEWLCGTLQSANTALLLSL